MDVTKTAVVTQNDGNSANNSGDLITYTITIVNNGGVTLSGLTLVDTLTDGNGSGLSITGPSFASASAGSTSSTLLSSGVVTYTATYVISQGAANSGALKILLWQQLILQEILVK